MAAKNGIARTREVKPACVFTQTRVDDDGYPVSAARAFPLTGIKAAERDKALAYFETNAPRMRYTHFRSHGLFAGSGVAEGGCKSVIAQRLKLSGMH